MANEPFCFVRDPNCGVVHSFYSVKASYVSLLVISWFEKSSARHSIQPPDTQRC